MTLNSKKCLITGGSGFVGTNLALKLLDENRNIKIFDVKKPKIDNVDYINGDVTKLNEVMDATKDVDVIFHLASLVPQSKVDKNLVEKILILGTENVLKACKKNNIKLIHISSTAVYGSNRQGASKESDEKRPYGGYGIGKWKAEEICQKYVNDGVNVVILRPVGIIGPYISGLVLKFIKFIHFNVPIMIIGSGKNKIQLLSVSDCIDAILLAEKYDGPGEVFNIGSENVPQFRFQIQKVVEQVKSKSIVIPLQKNIAKLFFAILYKINLTILPPDHYRMLDKDIIVDISKAKNILKWKPQKDNIQMMVEAYNWYYTK